MTNNKFIEKLNLPPPIPEYNFPFTFIMKI